jgi:hypothetical protein
MNDETSSLRMWGCFTIVALVGWACFLTLAVQHDWFM